MDKDILLRKSIRSHKNIASVQNRETMIGKIKFAYHMNVANVQKNEKRILSNNEKQKIWNENYDFGHKYWK